MKKLVWCFFLLLSGCMREHYINVLSVDPAFQQYIKVFEEESKRIGHPVIVNNLYAHFASPYFKMSDTILGECFDKDHGIGGNPVILINRTAWYNNSPETNEMVFLHELGHCFLWRKHLITFNGPNGNITSIMYPYILDSNIYFEYWDYYMRELFHD